MFQGRNLIFYLLVIFQWGCALNAPRSSKNVSQHKVQRKTIEKLRDENRVLKQLLSQRNSKQERLLDEGAYGVKPQATPSIVSAVKNVPPPTPKANVQEMKIDRGVSAIKKSEEGLQLRSLKEEDLFRQALEAYQKGDLESLRKITGVISSQYPDGYFADDCWYYYGLTHFARNNMDEALKAFDHVATRFPFSNKRSSSLFAKAMTLKKMGLKDEARSQLQDLSMSYPGSTEALRSQLEIKLLNTN